MESLLSKREYLAAILPDIESTMNGREAEQLVGRKAPEGGIERIKYFAEVRALLRFIEADAFIKVSEK